MYKHTQQFNGERFSWYMGNCLRTARKSAGLTQTQLASLLDTEQPSIARAERGNISSVKWFTKAIAACGFKVSGFLTIENNAP